jgi:3-hydroxyacyl-CoA dehydrogenase/enoyl-CoA hydratase/3-hydroxybutyryl-CoA epimerase/3-hydroxyacyl-CoA dehydrogenase/enoyl-CoA hydratase/3-hydroxybutyryl-CoA epimerase/enoyl-CoA isomerase
LRPDHKTRATTTLEDRALQNVRLLVERNRQDIGLDRGGMAPRAIRSAGIIGAGLMGTAIAAAHVRHGLRVVITDADSRALAAAPQRIAAALAGGAPDAQAQRLVSQCVETAAEEAAVARCDLVLEAIVETFKAKNKLYSHLEGQLPPETILASNTSTIPVGRLAAFLSEPARFCGFHFCHPVQERPLVEIVRGPKTGDPAIATLVAHAKAIGKMPIVVRDGPGFLVNRLLLPYLGEALELLLEGVSMRAIEEAAGSFGMAKGPLRLLDEIGLDTVLQGGVILAEAFPERTIASPLLVAMVKAGRLGCKAGAGFFRYATAEQLSGPAATPATAEATDEETVGKIIARWARPSPGHTPHSITARLMLPMVLEATRVLEENKVRDPRDIDLAAIFGLGFPSTRGGLLWWADTLGARRILEMLRPLERLGPRTQPTPMLRDLARSHGHFYQAVAATAAARPAAER